MFVLLRIVPHWMPVVGGREVADVLPSAVAAGCALLLVALIGKMLYDTLFYDHYRP